MVAYPRRLARRVETSKAEAADLSLTLSYLLLSCQEPLRVRLKPVELNHLPSVEEEAFPLLAGTILEADRSH